jgi:hypothetical protein
MNMLGYYVAVLVGAVAASGGLFVFALWQARSQTNTTRVGSLGRNLPVILAVLWFNLFLAASVGLLARLEAERAKMVLIKLSSFALDARTLVGFILLLLAWRMWRQSVTPRPFATIQQARYDDDRVVREEPRIGFTRHWGGLGAGEGGWEIEPATARWGLSVFLLVALSAGSATMLWRAADDAATYDSKKADAGAEGSSPAATTPSPGTADGGAGDARPADAANGGD